MSWSTTASDIAEDSYDRTPSCGELHPDSITQCSQFFHEVTLDSLEPVTKYYYQIPGGNGTTPSEVLHFTTALPAGNSQPFAVAVLNDMGYTNAQGTHDNLVKAVGEGLAFAWHGGDTSYADDWYSGITPCEDSWPVCYNGSKTELPGPAPIPVEYYEPLPAGEVPTEGGPLGGDISVIYESYVCRFSVVSKLNLQQLGPLAAVDAAHLWQRAVR